MTNEEFKLIREELKLSQTKLAKHFRCHRNTIDNYERGRTQIPYAVERLLLTIKGVYESTKK
jgi:DNA-binding transcriptional regulator YiaG